jgi:Tfp pilus assembly protein PilO
MKALKPKSVREQILLVFLVFSTIIASYIIFRVQDKQLEVLVLKEQLDSIKSELTKFKIEQLSKTKVSDLKEELDALKVVISGELITLTGFEENFTDLTQNDAVAKVREEITRLCDANKLNILSINRSNVELASLAQAQTAQSDQILDRPQFTIKLRGEFSQFKSLLYQIKSLPYMVVVTQISINANNQVISTYQPELTALLTFAF